MSKPSTRIVVAIAATFVLTGCAQAGAPMPATDLGTLPTPVPLGEVLGQGTVLDDGGEAELCLGAIAESYPPQCSGLPIDGWDWDVVDGWEDASGVRWGSYAVQGTFDGERFAVVGEPVLLALYDPMPIDEEPRAPGTTSQADLERIHDELADALGDAMLMSRAEEGRLDVTVVYDDGTLQQHLDDAYGDADVHVVSALRDVGP